MENKLLVSACLAGELCRYDGKSQVCPQIKKWVDEGKAVAVCPEWEGGLITPRKPCEIIESNGERQVINTDQEDKTAAFQTGAERTLAIAKANGCTKAVLKARSPSCGVGEIYDGSFSHRIIEGDGLTAALLRENGIELFTEENFSEGIMENKKRIGVVFGGQSGEHEVSCVSVYNVLNAIDQEKYDVTCIGITKKGEWLIYNGEYENIKDGSWEKDEDHVVRDFSLMTDEIITGIDVFFPVLHGPMGEDGTIQGVFEILGKPYVGCGVLSSAMGMDKVISKIMFEVAGIPVAPYVSFKARQWAASRDQILEIIEGRLGLPAFVKPANMGSSVGITKAHDREELAKGIDNALIYDSKVLVESFVDGREIECAVLEEEGEFFASIPGEIVASKEFYDYEAKYADDQDSEIIIPAEITNDDMQLVRQYAVKAMEAIDGSGLARVDFFLTKEHEVIINEVNTMPGFTSISMYPKMWENMGIPYGDLIDRLIKTAARKRNIDYLNQS